eukprot:TRINITY_DN7696_c0_g2_i1.p1 TRINITY_DN7696_c0_g2~~TRINITY_DN7696_c0_g2_i1.p1  ORF type:complete len:886 (+),score=265.61 TRINITY_DN7696_c0_g2_i1:348-2660(+)
MYRLKQIFTEVSDPDHERYGKYLTMKELSELIAPEERAFEHVGDWLLSHGVATNDIRRLNDHLEVTTDAQTASALFQTNIGHFYHPTSDSLHARVSGQFSIPEEIGEHITLVTGLSELFPHNGRQAVMTSYRVQGADPYDIGGKPDPRHQPFQSMYHHKAHKTGVFAQQDNVETESFDERALRFKPQQDASSKAAQPVIHPENTDTGVQQLVTPTILRDYYGIPRTERNENLGNKQGIGAFNDVFRLKALCQFQSTFENRSKANEVIKRVGSNVGSGEFESDLDIQTMTAIGKGIETVFNNKPHGAWVLDYAQEVVNGIGDQPYVHSLSYGYPELMQCGPGQAVCTHLGYNAETYVTKFNEEMMKWGASGRTMFVASGDDGANGFGNCDIDMDRMPCPLGPGNCNCSKVMLVDTAKNAHCVLPTGFFNQSCALTKNSTSDCFQALKQMSDTLKNHTRQSTKGTGKFCHGDVQWHQMYSNCTCDEIEPVTVGSCTASAVEHNPSFGPPMLAVFPGSSPWVTSVGATAFQGETGCGSGSLKFAEQTANLATGSGFSTGGGFSQYEPQPDYQKEAIKGYFEKVPMPVTSDFNRNNRGYPDISLNGRNYVVVASRVQGNDHTGCCSVIVVDGTSASTPAVAGMFALINGKLLAQKRPVVGFLNPTLYKMKKEVFNDVTIGDNRCTKYYCCKTGFNAAEGWDPTTGLGTPKYQELLKHFGVQSTPAYGNVDVIFWLVIGILSAFLFGVSAALFVTCQRLESAKKGAYSQIRMEEQ